MTFNFGVRILMKFNVANAAVLDYLYCYVRMSFSYSVHYVFVLYAGNG